MLRRFRCLIGLAPLFLMAADAAASIQDPVLTFSYPPARSTPFVGKGKLTVDFSWVRQGETDTRKVTLGPFDAGANKSPEALRGDIIQALLSDTEIKKDYTFSESKSTDSKSFFISAAKVDGRTPTFKRAQPYVAKTADVGVYSKYSGAVDPLLGLAQWDVTLGDTESDTGQVGIGIGGYETITTTYNPSSGSPKSLLQIKMDLLKGLQDDLHYTSAFIDPSSGYITLDNADTGDPLGTDGFNLGASFFSTDADVGGLCAIQIPTPASVAALGLGVLVRTRRRR